MPPSSRWTGWPTALPMMSHKAVSIAAIASISMPPERPEKVRKSFCQTASASNGSMPRIFGAKSPSTSSA